MTQVAFEEIEQFRNSIQKALVGLSKKQQVAFARRCALHALPYLFADGHMNFWPQDKKLNHAYAIFNALDICHGYVTLTRDNSRIESLRAARAAYAARAYAYAYDADAYVSASVSASASADASASAANAAYRFNRTNIQPLIRKDLQDISNNHTPTSKVDYPAALWQNFQQALINEKCGYWAKLYQQIFDNDLVVDADELQQRLNVPEEIKAQGAGAVGHYMEQLDKGAELLNESRILILGDKGAGKTCLARRLKNPFAEMTTTDESTAGVDTTTWILNKADTQASTKVRIWDFAGHTVTHAVHQFFLSERCLYILVYNGRTEQSNRLEYWLDHMKNYGGDSKAVIVVNEKDNHKITIPENKLKEKYAIHSVHYLSINDEQQMVDFGSQVTDIISYNLCWDKQEIPTSYYQVKADLEKLFDSAGSSNNSSQNSKEHINYAEFKKITKRYNIDDPKQLLTDLDALGVSLWYPDLTKFDRLVLNPEWISHGVYQIINWVANLSADNIHKPYSINLNDFKYVFESADDVKRFGVEHHEFLYRLIMHYQLAYESQTQTDTLIIPHLLQEDQPTKDLLPSFEIRDSLKLEYQAKQPLPPHTISRFIVKHNLQIKDNLVWRTGVVLVDSQYPDTIAQVKEDDRDIEICVKGSNKTAYIDELRGTMNGIFNSYQSDKPDLMYEVIPFGPMNQPVTLNEPLMLDERKLINHVNSGESYYEDQTKQHISLNQTVNIYNIKAKSFYQGEKINVDNSITYNYQDCNFELQGGLNELVQELEGIGQQAQIKQLNDALAAFEKAENCQTPAEVKKSGAGSRMKRLLEDMGDKNSSLHKAIEGTKNGVKIAQDLAEKYNSIAQWAGMPQVPKLFLKK